MHAWGPGSCISSENPDAPTGRGTFWGGNNWACPSLPTVNILNIIDKGGSSDATFGYLLPVTYLLLCLWEGCEMLWSVLDISKIT